MKTTLMSRCIAVVLLLLTVSVWSFVLWMACHVSLIILQTLEQIVQLADL
jgi:hypothetical protein